jgi:fibronectin-binding autotransporter adhesin
MSRYMSFRQTVLRGVYSVLAAAMLSAMWQPVAAAAIYYWDTNGSTSGFGTASGTWGGSDFFSTSSTGVVATTSVTTTILDDLNFGQGSTLGLATGTISVNSAQEIRSLTYGAQSGAITLTGGTITLAATATITTNQGTNINTIESVLAGASTGLTKAGVASSTLALTAANTYTGVTSVTLGTLAVRGADGSIGSSSAVAISGGTLLLDNSTSVSAHHNQS